MVAYIGQGVCFAVLVTRIPALQEKFGLSDGVLGLLVGLVPIIAGVGSVVAGSAFGIIGRGTAFNSDANSRNEPSGFQSWEPSR